MGICLDRHWFSVYSENLHRYAYSGSNALEAVKTAQQLDYSDQVRIDVEHPDDRVCSFVTDVMETSIWFRTPLPEWIS